MPEQSVIHNTFVIERSYPKPPETVFAAFADPTKKRRWFGEGHNHDVEEFTTDFRVGGQEHFQYRLKEGTPFPGVALNSQRYYLDIVPNQRIVEAADMAIGGRRISTSLVTVEFRPSPTGTDLVLTHQAAFFDGADGPEMRQDGWRKLLDNLATALAG